MIERRQHRRTTVEVEVEMWCVESEGRAPTRFKGQVRDVSLAGLYAWMPASCPLQPGEVVACTVNIPQPAAKRFPFSRLLGKGWIVRRHPAEEETVASSRPEVGMAVAFTRDVTALSTMAS